ncbi:CorA family divalent cation transporter [Methylobacterium pseudosasicola]|uniref:Magnesium transporter/zinc transporter n=1 Tax=Methylobacterium pseudosasicola TaxID=582667 RepID=A0A1I4SKY3_9HYPH|nr:CorA family divalent cation transporter [Methylobacterium pseudosasicola]SFM65020.1 magnesium transporter/zinc transporter [Methylobacterium pseudosasicola]
MKPLDTSATPLTTTDIAGPARPGEPLWAMAFDADGRGRAVPAAEVVADLGTFGGGFIWLHYDLEVADLAGPAGEGRFGPTRLATAVFARDEHQRVTVEAGHVGGVVADLARPGAKPAPAGRLHFVMGPRGLVSGRRGPAESPDATRAAVEGGDTVASPTLLLETLVGHVVSAMATTGQRLSDALDGIEDHILDGRPRDDRRRLGPVRRNAVRLHRQIAGLAAVFHRLEADGATDDVHGPAVAAAARLAQRLDALDRDMTLQAERARLLQEEVSERIGEATNRQLYVLSVLSALFLPPTFITGLFGMNVKGLPLGDDPRGFLAVCGLGLASAVLAFAVIRLLGIRPPRG